MPAGADLRDDYIDFLMEKCRQVMFPSLELLNRIEGSIRTREHAQEYVQLLMDKNQSIFPSLGLLDRTDRVIRLMEIQERRSS